MATYEFPPIAAALPDVVSDRLILRRFEVTDLDELAGVFAKPEVWRFPYRRAFTRRETEVFINRQIEEWDTCGFGCWLAQARDSGQVIGYLGLSVPMFLPEILPAVEVGWRLDPTFWGQGLATEGARRALREAFDTLQLDEVTSVPQADNPPSARVCERLGMRLERGVTIPANDQRGELEALLFTMSRDRWAAQSSASD